MKRHVYFISDGTGITAEILGHSLLTQFESVEFIHSTLPFIDTIDKAKQVKNELDKLGKSTNSRILVFATLINTEIRQILKQSNCFFVDFFGSYLDELKQELRVESVDTAGLTHGIGGKQTYEYRIDAINFALSTDDGIGIQYYQKSEIILVGASRCGKTPTCLYLALQYGILAANYPFTEEDLRHQSLPASLTPYRQKLFGLTIDPRRLAAIRHERRPNSRYSSLKQCRQEIREVERIYQQEKIPFVSTTSRSIEEISAIILTQEGLKRKTF